MNGPVGLKRLRSEWEILMARRPRVLIPGALMALALLVTPAAIAQSVSLSIESEAGFTGQSVEVSSFVESSLDLIGWTYGACHEPSRLQLFSIEDGFDVAVAFPDFNQRDIFDGGWTVSVVFFGPGTVFLPAGSSELNRATYEVLEEGAAEFAPILLCGSLGTPPTGIQFVTPGGFAVDPSEVERISGGIQVNPVLAFRRGDTNDDGSLNLADPVFLLERLFYGGAPLACRSAGDADDSGALDIADVIVLLGVMFYGEGPLASPGMICGLDPTPDELDCMFVANCP